MQGSVMHHSAPAKCARVCTTLVEPLVSPSTALIACRQALPDIMVAKRHLAAAQELAHAWLLPEKHTTFHKKEK